MSRDLKPGHSLVKAAFPVPIFSDSNSDTRQDALASQHTTPQGPSGYRIASMSVIGTIPYRSILWQQIMSEETRESRENGFVVPRESAPMNNGGPTVPSDSRRDNLSCLKRRFEDDHKGVARQNKEKRAVRDVTSQQKALLHKETPTSLSLPFNTRRLLFKGKFDHDPRKNKSKPSRRVRPQRLDDNDDDIDHTLTLTAQISRAGEITALAAHVEDMETMGRGAGGMMPSIDILGSARELLGTTPADAPGLPGTGYSVFALCGVVGVVERIMAEDASDPGDAWYGSKYVNVDLEDAKFFVSEDLLADESLGSFKSGATSAEKPEKSLLNWPGWFDDGYEVDPDGVLGERKLEAIQSRLL